MSRTPSILVVDDDPNVVAWLVEALQEEGFAPEGEVSAQAALALLDRRRFDVVISDVEMPELRGTELLRAILERDAQQMVLLITAFGSIDLAVESVRAGAIDFLAKPFRIEVLVLALRRALRERQMRREISRLRVAASGEPPRPFAVRSEEMKAALDLAGRAARSHLPVLLTGESGVGKGALARFIHDHGNRREGRFVHLNCAALPAGVAEAELFGVRRGAYTDAREDRPGVFVQAHRGTLFLDEIGELPLELQPKLLQALESSRIRPLGGTEEVPADVRVIAATNQPLEEALRARTFRQDLYHRLNVIRIEIPPLRARVEDVDGIVEQAVAEIARRSGRPLLAIEPEALRSLRARPWPGNVRELINAVERAAALSESDLLAAEDFDLGGPNSATDCLEGLLDRDLSLQELERAYIVRVLKKTGGHKGNAARILGLDRRTLYRKVAEIEGRRLVDTIPDDDRDPRIDSGVMGSS